MRIFTLTLNPAYDVHVHTQHFEAFHEHIATVLSREAGGKGVNISRALQSGKVENTAVIIVGEDNAAEYRRQLAEDGLSVMELARPGSIRENLTVHCNNGPETRISFTGFNAGDENLDEIFTRIRPDPDTFITMTGRIANGMTMERVKAFLLDCAALGAKIVVDSRSFSLSDLAQVRPWLIKPNQEEISAYCGAPVEDMETAAQKAKALSSLGIENTLVSMGSQGALLITGGKVYFAKAPQVEAVSTIGAGDSMIAGFLAATADGEGNEGRLKRAVAYGTAACLTEGTQPPSAETVSSLLPQVQTAVLSQ